LSDVSDFFKVIPEMENQVKGVAIDLPDPELIIC
jgi:hypothetical protein